MRSFVPPVALLFCLSCGSAPRPESPEEPPAAACTPPPPGTAPTYSQLYDRYFARGTPGHCATAHCHASPGFDVWQCGETKDACYAGMVDVGLIDPKNPTASLIGNPGQSPLSWVNPTGSMPFDATGPLPPARDAILSWVAACARND